MAHTPPLLTQQVHEQMGAARSRHVTTLECSLDLERSLVTVELGESNWRWREHVFPYLQRCKDRTIYYWDGEQFAIASRYSNALIKLVPTEWGAPTFEIDGIKMLPTAQVSPYEDARNKVAWIEPRGKTILDTCGGLGYFAAWCVAGDATRVMSFEKNADVMWLRSLNPWSPAVEGALTLTHADIAQHITTLPDQSFDAVLHDPPRFGIAGELYSQVFYDHLARVLKPRGKLFHYTGMPNKLSTGRDVPNEVAKRLRTAGFTTQLSGDGVRALKK